MDVDVPGRVSREPGSASIHAGLPSFPAWVFLAAAAAGAAIVACLLAGIRPIAPLPQLPSDQALLVERTVLQPGQIELDLRNTTAAPITVSQVAVDLAFFDYTMTPRRVASRDRAKLLIDYPWQVGRKIPIFLLTTTGNEITDVIISPAQSPPTSPRSRREVLLYIGLILTPLLAASALWWIAHSTASLVGTFLAGGALGVLAALLLSSVREALRAAQAVSVFIGGRHLVEFVAVTVLFVALYVRKATASGAGFDRRGLALLAAVGVGVYGFGHGVALGHGLATGAVALGNRRSLALLAEAAAGGLAVFGAFGDGDPSPLRASRILLAIAVGAPAALGVAAGRAFGTATWSAAGSAAGVGALAVAVWCLGARWLGDHREVSNRAAVFVLATFFVTSAVALAA